MPFITFIIGYLVGTAIVFLAMWQVNLYRIFMCRLFNGSPTIVVELCCRKHMVELSRLIEGWFKETAEKGADHEHASMESPSTRD